MSLTLLKMHSQREILLQLPPRPSSWTNTRLHQFFSNSNPNRWFNTLSSSRLLIHYHLSTVAAKPESSSIISGRGIIYLSKKTVALLMRIRGLLGSLKRKEEAPRTSPFRKYYQVFTTQWRLIQIRIWLRLVGSNLINLASVSMQRSIDIKVRELSKIEGSTSKD